MEEAEPAARQAQVYQLGLALAGAISAGAYTAGALDFLFQALSEWEANRGNAGVPDHRVVLKVIAGASAGAITGALGAVALARGLHPRGFSSDQAKDFYPDSYKTHQRWQCVLPSLYRTWVELPAMVGRDGVGGLLGTNDIETAADATMLRSLLDATLLDDIKRAALKPGDGDADQLIGSPVPFVAQRLHVYMTISNMRGIPFKVGFGRNSYGMQTIGDRIHYVVTDLGDCDLANKQSWVEEDAREASLSISVKTLPGQQDNQLGDWDVYGTAALASGAFPLGLASRRLSFKWAHYTERRYPIPIPPGVAIQPSFPLLAAEQDAFTFESVDGGLVNNDPFDYAQYALTGEPGKPTDGTTVDRAIVMVAPFPEPPEFLPEGSPSPAVTAILRALFPAVMNQSRFRTSELAPAVNERDFGRFLIAPLRRIPRATPTSVGAQAQSEPFPIACGLLGGFGGFLDEKFRAHDFQLGRRNCQQFLRTSFLVPPDNVVVGRPRMTDMQPVIPLIGSAADPVPLPQWPQMSVRDFERLCDRMAKRIDAVMPLLINAQTPNLRLRTALKIGWRVFLRARVTYFVRQMILADLVRRGQIEGWDVPAGLDGSISTHKRTKEDAQAIVAELINPAFDYRTANGIARKTHLPADFVRAVLNELSRPNTPTAVRTWADPLGYTLVLYRPSFFKRLGLIRWFNRWWNPPTVN
jgi:hypothetical protein